MKRALQLRRAFRWEGPVEDWVKTRIVGYSLNVPCGDSTLGDVRVDRDVSAGGATQFADMNKLPFPDRHFDTVISDPPWALNLFHRPRQFFEVFRVCKVGGVILYNATWLPSTKFDGVFDIEEVFVRQSATFANVSLLLFIRKIREVPS